MRSSNRSLSGGGDISLPNPSIAPFDGKDSPERVTCRYCLRLGNLRSYARRVIDHDEMPETEAPLIRGRLFFRGRNSSGLPDSRFAAQYRVIVDVPLAEQETSLTGLSHDEAAAGWYHADRLWGWFPRDHAQQRVEGSHIPAKV
jgi:hypothetical protein